MDQAIMEQLQLIVEKLSEMPTRDEVFKEIQEAETRTRIFVENAVKNE